MSRGFPWGVLGIEPTTDRKAIRSAYAARLKAINPDEDVAGFAELRRAREEALWRAKDQNQLPDEGLGDGELNDWFAGDFADDYAEVPPAPDAPPVEQPKPDPKPGRFLDILFPGGEHSDAALTHEEYAEGAELLQAIMAEAQDAAIDKQGGMEDWLSHHLASAWPRSGPLVEDAVKVFHWDREAGMLDELPAVAFLNARLKALAFLDQLQQPGHQWHKAYVELRKPGPRSRLPWQGTSIKQVTDLLVHIREHYPELEEFLDGERVHSYVQTDEPGSPWKWSTLIVVVMIAFVRICSTATDNPSADYSGPPPVPAYAPDAWTNEQKQDILDELFGPGVSYGSLADSAPEFYRQFGDMSNMSFSPENAVKLLRSDLRRRVLDRAADAPFTELVAIKQYELNLIRWLRANEGAEACAAPQVWYGGQDAFAGDEALTEEGRALARRLLDAGLFREPRPDFPDSAAIPGEVVQAMMDRSGMTRAQFDAAANREGPVALQCTYRVTLLEEILRRPGSVSADLLRIG